MSDAITQPLPVPLWAVLVSIACMVDVLRRTVVEIRKTWRRIQSNTPRCSHLWAGNYRCQNPAGGDGLCGVHRPQSVRRVESISGRTVAE